MRKKLARIIALSFISLLAACTTVQKDGPPPYEVDVSNIHDAVPRKEPLSRSGNKPYQVFGKRYSVMKSSVNYKERGVASWYGMKFHKRYTSSGERYDMLAMTAAHKSLPLPTYVEVKNLKNGKKIIVKVNDRGPFESSRLIDLSYAAAKKLDIVGHGTAKVEITAINPGDENTDVRAPVLKEHGIFVQVGAFKNKAYAEKLKRDIEAVTKSPVFITEIHKAEAKLYRVQIGPVPNRTSANHIHRQLGEMGITNKV